MTGAENGWRHPSESPDKPAVVMAGSGETLTYRALDEASRRAVSVLRSRGAHEDGHVALVLENRPEILTVAWAAQRSGLFYTALNAHCSADEMGYVLGDTEPSVVVASPVIADRAPVALAAAPHAAHLSVGGDLPGFERLEPLVEQAAPWSGPDTEGADLLYSSGTTGRPKGIRSPRSSKPFGQLTALGGLLKNLWGFGPDTVYLSTAPLYHAGPLRFALNTLRLGGTVVVMERFDAEAALRAIERYRVTHSQWVPTMFVRLLRLPDDVRARYDISSLRAAIHAAAPCPPDVKERMIAWWGDAVKEYYAGSEATGFTAIDADEWLRHRGSVGKPLRGTVHVVDDELPPGEVGRIFFEGGGRFEYFKDPAKTASVTSPQGWTTYGDVGHVDEEGYLYLGDRGADLILVGGANVYPAEVEAVLGGHPDVDDVAVVGIADEDMGEGVKAVVKPADAAVDPALERRLLEWCRQRLARVKCPRSVDFVDELPRQATGKLYRREVRDRYRDGGRPPAPTAVGGTRR